MKTEALVLVEQGRVDVTEIDVPDPGPGEVMVEVKANGICRGDIALFTGEMNYGYPFFHGHEPAGIVSAVGPGVKDLAAGDRVACLGSPSYRRHIITHASRTVKIDDPSPDFALWISEPAACAVNGVDNSNLHIGDAVALIGCGYMGMLVFQALPREVFRRLIVVDVDESRLALARSLGAAESFSSKETDLVALSKEIGGFDVVIEAAGVPGTLPLATNMLRSGGTLNIFGWHGGEETLPTHEWHYKGLRVLNTAPMFVHDFNIYFKAAVALMQTGRIDQTKLITHRFAFAEAQRGFEVAAGRKEGYVKGVFTF